MPPLFWVSEKFIFEAVLKTDHKGKNVHRTLSKINFTVRDNRVFFQFGSNFAYEIIIAKRKLPALLILENKAIYCSPKNTLAMKKTFPFLLAAFIAAFAIGCTGQKEIQMDFADVQLIRIDTIQRYDAREKLLTWRSDDQVEYVTFVPIEMHYPLGTRMKAMVKR